MRFANFDDTTFVNAFGEEGYELLEGYNNDLYLIGNDSAATFNLDPSFGAAVVPFLYTGTTEPVNVLVINVERCYEEMPILVQLNKAAFQKSMRAMLVHERTHIKQMEEGRLVTVGGTHYWEGEIVHVSQQCTEAYLTTPWEIEAYVNQFMYEFGITAEEARTQLFEGAARFKAA